MKLKDLILEYAYQVNPKDLNIEISNIEIDSRLVKKGSIFFALKGNATNGEKFIESALQNGALAVIASYHCKGLPGISPEIQKKIIGVKDVYETLSLALSRFYTDLPENIFAITGTNGKTSIVNYIWQMQEILGIKAASIGTIGVQTSDKSIEGQLTNFSLTTPDIISLYKNLEILKKGQINDVSIEASSIGLEQKRLLGLKIGLGAFTNFTQDHLDYHDSMEKYFESKMLLFSQVVKEGGIAVLNADIEEFGKINKIALNRNLRVFRYSADAVANHADCQILKEDSEKIIIKLLENKYQINIETRAGRTGFQISNILCALLCVVSYYKPSQEQINLLISKIDEIKPAQGRMQLVAALKSDAQIFIDYAHTPDALKNILSTARQMPHNKIYVVFGCGGNRDKDKRSKMGKIASDLADYVIITDDNPRNEDPSSIRKEILSACDLNKTIETSDRETAIYQAILILKKNDILIIAGKGHEKYQIIGDEKHPFDEEKIIKEFVESREL
jgi:UDP-N-acetylmuramyl-tripeptide synthetase